MIEIQVPLDVILQSRRERNIPLYASAPKNGYVKLYLQVENNIIKTSSVAIDDPIHAQIKDFFNKDTFFTDKRIVTYDFTDNTTWPTLDDSSFKAAPDSGKVLYVTSIQIRFPEDIRIKNSNKMYFTIYKDVGAGVQPIVHLEYDSVRDLVKKLNTPLIIPPSNVTDISTKKLVEVSVEYADPNTLKGAPIVLSSSKGEYIEIGLVGNVPLQDVNDVDYDSSNECWAVINGRQCLDF